jgi:hypothetical protein
MNCRDFTAWLDAGGTSNDPADRAAHAHMRGCARCAALQRAALEIDALLGTATSPAPAGFVARVASRLAAESAASGVRAPAPSHASTPSRPPWFPALPAPLSQAPLLPLWVRVLTQPACIAAGVVAALWGAILAAGSLLRAGGPAALELQVLVTPWREWLAEMGSAALFTTPLRQFGVAVAVLPLVVLGAMVLYRTTLRSCLQGKSRIGW